MNHLKIYCFFIAIFVCIVVLFYTPIFNKRFNRFVDTKFIDGTCIKVLCKHSEHNYIGRPLVFHVCIGVDMPSEYKWRLDGLEYKFESELMPFIINKNNDNLFIVASDNARYAIFRFYKYENNKWMEILPKEFPKKIAYQNFYTKGRSLAFLELNSSHFTASLTGQLWSYLETNKNYRPENNNEFYVTFAKVQGITDEMLNR